jgi:hypothetical protein
MNYPVEQDNDWDNVRDNSRDNVRDNPRDNSRDNNRELNKTKTKTETKTRAQTRQDVFADSNESDEIKALLADLAESRKKNKKPMTDKAKELLLKKLYDFSNGDERIKKAMLENAIEHGWMTVYPLKDIPVDTPPTLSPEEIARKQEENNRRYEAAMQAQRAKVAARYGGALNGNESSQRSAS